MEPVYQNSVSEFDLNFLEHTTTGSQLQPVQCPEAKHLMLYRIKRRIKGTSTVIKRATVTNKVLSTLQLELQETKTELEVTRKLLFEKNEELKDSCMARNNYYEKAERYENDLKAAKEKIKQLEEKDYDFDSQQKVTAFHIDQIKALENILSQKDTKRSGALLQACKGKGILEKKLIKVLNDYVQPQIKKRDKWLETLMKKYLPNEKCDSSICEDSPASTKDADSELVPISPQTTVTKNEENQKTHGFTVSTTVDISNSDEGIIDSTEPLASNTMVNRNNNLDFEYVGSVDTGRGSSLALSDCEKSFHSPDYYMTDSPLSSAPLCSKCNLPKSDASTSPMEAEIFDVVDNFAAVRCILVSKRDACTSPTPLNRLNAMTDTTDIDTAIATQPLHRLDAATDTSEMDACSILGPLQRHNAATDTFNIVDESCHIKELKIKSNINSATNCDKLKNEQSSTSSVKPLVDITKDTDITNSHYRTSSPIDDLFTIPADENMDLNLPNSADSVSSTSRQASPVEDWTILSEDEEEVSASNSNIPCTDVSNSPAVLQLSSAEILHNDIKIAKPVEDTKIPELEHNAAINHIPILSEESLKSPVALRKNKIANTTDFANDTRKVVLPVDNFSIIPEECQEKAISTDVVTSTNKSRNTAVKLLHNCTLNSEETFARPVKLKNIKIISNNDYDKAAQTCTVNKSSLIPLEVSDDNVKLSTTELNNNNMKAPLEDSNIIENRKLSTPNSCSFSILEMPRPPTILSNLAPKIELDIRKSTVQEKECLELNNSYNTSKEVFADSEIQTILNNMQFRQNIITPIPKTPIDARYATQSPLHTCGSCDLLHAYYQKEINRILEQFEGPKRELKDLAKNGRTHFIRRDCILSDTVDKVPSEVHILQESTQQIFSEKGPEIKLSKKAEAVQHSVDMLQYNTETECLDQMTRSNINQIIQQDICQTQSSRKKLSFEMKMESMFGENSPDNRYNVDETDLQENNDSNSNNNMSLDNYVSKDLDQSCNYNNDIKTVSTESSGNEELLSKKRKKKKLSKLEKIRLKMLPKSKIKQDIKPRVRKTLLKHMSTISLPKKINTDVHTATTSHVRSDNNIGEIFTALNKRILKEPVVIVEDCLQNDCQIAIKSEQNILIMEPKFSVKSKEHPIINNEQNISDTSKKNKKRNLSSEFENVSMVKPKLINNDYSAPMTRKRSQSFRSPEKCDVTLPNFCSNESMLIKNKKPSVEQTPDEAESKKHITSQRSNANIVNGGENCATSLNLSNDSKPRKRTLSSRLSKDNRNNTVDADNIVDETVLTKRCRKTSLRGSNEKPFTIQLLDDTETSAVKLLKGTDTKCKNNLECPESINIKYINPKTNDVIYESPTTRGSRTKLQPFKTAMQLSDDTETSEVLNVDETIRKNNLGSPESNVKHIHAKINDIIYKTPTTRSSMKKCQPFDTAKQVLDDTETSDVISNGSICENNKESPESKMKHAHAINKDIINMSSTTRGSQKKRQVLLDSPLPSQRTLRSTFVKQSVDNTLETSRLTRQSSENKNIDMQKKNENIISYEDLDLFTNEDHCNKKQDQCNEEALDKRTSILCTMIEKHGVNSYKKRTAKKYNDTKINEIRNKLETSIADITEMPYELAESALKKLIYYISQKNLKQFLLGLKEYLQDSGRKLELFSKHSIRELPITKQEQVLVFVLKNLNTYTEYRDVIKKIYLVIEHALFDLNKSPDFDAVESLSHFYAVLCFYYQDGGKLRTFLLDAMYCLKFKSIILVKQCLDVWPFILPLAHTGNAKSPLNICLVYLLHFFKCEDKGRRVDDLRFLLKRKYGYVLSDWNETKILDFFKTAIIEVKDHPQEKKMLRLALLILAKRNGAKWCHTHIVTHMLQPIIADESASDMAKRFCVALLGPLVKPYPNAMKVNSELVTDYLFGLLDQKQSQKMQEAILYSLICSYKQDKRVDQFLMKWNPKKLSPEFQSTYIDYVKSKPIRQWQYILSKIQ